MGMLAPGPRSPRVSAPAAACTASGCHQLQEPAGIHHCPRTPDTHPNTRGRINRGAPRGAHYGSPEWGPVCRPEASSQRRAGSGRHGQAKGGRAVSAPLVPLFLTLRRSTREEECPWPRAWRTQKGAPCAPQSHGCCGSAPRARARPQAHQVLLPAGVGPRGEVHRQPTLLHTRATPAVPLSVSDKDTSTSGSLGKSKFSHWCRPTV